MKFSTIQNYTWEELFNKTFVPSNFCTTGLKAVVSLGNAHRCDNLIMLATKEDFHENIHKVIEYNEMRLTTDNYKPENTFKVTPEEAAAATAATAAATETETETATETATQ